MFDTYKVICLTQKRNITESSNTWLTNFKASSTHRTDVICNVEDKM